MQLSTLLRATLLSLASVGAALAVTDISFESVEGGTMMQLFDNGTVHIPGDVCVGGQVQENCGPNAVFPAPFCPEKVCMSSSLSQGTCVYTPDTKNTKPCYFSYNDGLCGFCTNGMCDQQGSPSHNYLTYQSASWLFGFPRVTVSENELPVMFFWSDRDGGNIYKRACDSNHYSNTCTNFEVFGTSDDYGPALVSDVPSLVDFEVVSPSASSGPVLFFLHGTHIYGHVCADEQCNAGLTKVVSYSVGGGATGVAAALGANGLARVAVVSSTGVHLLTCNTADCDTYSTAVIVSFGSAPSNTADIDMLVDQNDNVFIFFAKNGATDVFTYPTMYTSRTYGAITSGDLIVIQCNAETFACTSTGHSLFHGDFQTFRALWVAGKPAVFYEDFTVGFQKVSLTYCDSFECEEPVTRTVVDGLTHSLDVTYNVATGYPIVWYASRTGTLPDATVRTATCQDAMCAAAPIDQASLYGGAYETATEVRVASHTNEYLFISVENNVGTTQGHVAFASSYCWPY